MQIALVCFSLKEQILQFDQKLSQIKNNEQIKKLFTLFFLPDIQTEYGESTKQRSSFG